MSNLKFFPGQMHVRNVNNDYSNFEYLYDTYAPKAYGFITKYSETKEQADKYLINVFLKVWDDIKTFEEHADKKIMRIVLLVCKPAYTKKRIDFN